MADEDYTQVMDAWTNPGPVPEYHAAAQKRLRIEWPALAHALDSVADRQRLKRAHPKSKSWAAAVDEMSNKEVAHHLNKL